MVTILIKTLCLGIALYNKSHFFPAEKISTEDEESDLDSAVCFNDEDVLQEPMIPGVKQMAVGLSCHKDELDVCVLRTFSATKDGKSNITGIKLACCDCGKFL